MRPPTVRLLLRYAGMLAILALKESPKAVGQALAQEHSYQAHHTYDDDQQAADAIYKNECGALTLQDCNTDVETSIHKKRVQAYRKAINAILNHLSELKIDRGAPSTQTYVYMLGVDSERADIFDRAYRFYDVCDKVLSTGIAPTSGTPTIFENEHPVSVKVACEAAKDRLNGQLYSSVTTIKIRTVVGDVWGFVADSDDPKMESIPGDAYDPGLGGKQNRGERAADEAPGLSSPTNGALAKSAEKANEAAAKAAVKQANDAAKAAKKQADVEARAAKKQADADAKAAKAAADAPAKAAKKEERDRSRAERMAKRQEEEKEHEKKN